MERCFWPEEEREQLIVIDETPPFEKRDGQIIAENNVIEFRNPEEEARTP